MLYHFCTFEDYLLTYLGIHPSNLLTRETAESPESQMVV